ncbi:hypothetical protein JTB14_029955 [Gonioctena quinquepunctata]|nr:hypothetical protein JTB14_029955 [Gonioctena quinquepunctata]
MLTRAKASGVAQVTKQAGLLTCKSKQGCSDQDTSEKVVTHPWTDLYLSWVYHQCLGYHRMPKLETVSLQLVKRENGTRKWWLLHQNEDWNSKSDLLSKTSQANLLYLFILDQLHFVTRIKSENEQ